MNKRIEQHKQALQKKYDNYSDRELLELQTHEFQSITKNTGTTANIMTFIIAIYIIGIFVAIIGFVISGS